MANQCIDCGTKVSRRDVKRCRPCSTIERHGRRRQKWSHCIMCGKEKTTYDQQIRDVCHPCGQKRRATTPEEARLKKNTARLIRYQMKRAGGGKKGGKTFEHLPYTPQELREHLETQFDDKMSWDNYGTYWHVDHIFPQSKMPYDSFEHPNFQKAWALSNLQPLEAIENIKKGAKIL